jgi:hypothetical protein
VWPSEGNRDDLRMVPADQGRAEASYELEVFEVIGSELHLKSARVEGQVRHRHDSGAVHQDVYGNAPCQAAVGEGVDRGRVQEVHRLDLDALDTGELRCGPRSIAGGHDHSGADLTEGYDLQAEAGRNSRR